MDLHFSLLYLTPCVGTAGLDRGLIFYYDIISLLGTEDFALLCNSEDLQGGGLAFESFSETQQAESGTALERERLDSV